MVFVVFIINTVLMKKIIVLIALMFTSIFLYGQEYDDMYFNKHDRKVKKKVYKSNRKHVNPEYIARYVSKPKVNVVVQSYHRPYYYNYNSWNLSFNYGYHYNYYGYPYYDTFYSWNYPHYRTFYSWNYPHPRHFGYYGSYYHHYTPHYSYYGSYNNYGHVNSYYSKPHVTERKNEVNYKPRKTRNTNYATNKPRTVDNSRIRKQVQTSGNKDVRNNRVNAYSTRPTYKGKSNTSRPIQQRSNYSRNNITPGNTRSSTYTAPRRSSYSTPSRSSSGRSYSTPSRAPSRAPSRSSSMGRSRK